MKKKIGRNDPCPCGSGKKFKKCCESKMLGRKYMATEIKASEQPKNLTSFFQNHVSLPTPLSDRKITAHKGKVNAPEKIDPAPEEKEEKPKDDKEDA